jgi:hypothetical protein
MTKQKIQQLTLEERLKLIKEKVQELVEENQRLRERLKE